MLFFLFLWLNVVGRYVCCCFGLYIGVRLGCGVCWWVDEVVGKFVVLVVEFRVERVLLGVFVLISLCFFCLVIFMEVCC